ncbi:MAG TPA: methyltransferase domain-containing protein, partial [Acidimicrobiales bacterium]|nr:methyltransferase domain-containing protein [Acidimicrobiales bacterium]
VGVDIDQKMVDTATDRFHDHPHVEIHLGDGHALPFEDSTFDRVRMDRALQHVATPSTVLSELLRVLKPGGLLGIGEPDWDVIADLEAGPTTPFERYHAFSEHVIVIIGPAWRSAMTARRLLPMAEGRGLTLVSNRFRDEPDHPGLAARVRIPFDPELAEVERQGLAPVDACPDSPAIVTITRLAEMFVNQEVPV